MKCKLWYDWSWDKDDSLIPQAAIELNDNVTLYARGKTFEEAKVNVIAKAQSLPRDEEVEI